MRDAKPRVQWVGDAPVIDASAGAQVSIDAAAMSAAHSGSTDPHPETFPS